MKHCYLAALFAFVLAFGATAQTADNNLSVGFHMGFAEYRGDLGDEYFTFNNVNVSRNISISKYISPSFDFHATLGYSVIDGTKRYAFERREFSTQIVSINLLARYKFANGKLLKEDFPVNPWIAIGVGDALSYADHYVFDVVIDDETGETRETSNSRFDFTFPFAVGISIPAGDRFQVVASSTHHYIMSDNIDHVENGDFNDQFLTHTLGIVYQFPVGAARKKTTN